MVLTIRRAARPRGSTDDVDAVAVTSGPGLVGVLLVGVAAAKGLAMSREAFVRREPPGGACRGRYARSTAICRRVASRRWRPAGTRRGLAVEDITEGVVPTGSTIDDAAGEAFDKVARVLGRRSRAGPDVDKAARDGWGDSAVRDVPAWARPSQRHLQRHRSRFLLSPGSRAPRLRGGSRRAVAMAEDVPVNHVAAAFQEAARVTCRPGGDRRAQGPWVRALPDPAGGSRRTPAPRDGRRAVHGGGHRRRVPRPGCARQRGDGRGVGFGAVRTWSTVVAGSPAPSTPSMPIMEVLNSEAHPGRLRGR